MSFADRPSADVQIGGVPPRRFWRAAALCLWALVFASLYFAWSTGRQRDPADATLPAVEPTRLDSHRTGETPEVADFELIERSGRKVTRADLLGRPWVICFVFTRCAGPCPRIMAQMKQLQEETAGTDVRLVALSVDPANDTPEVLTRYADAFGADPQRWWFLTGKREEIFRLITYDFKLPVGEQAGQPFHSNRVVHVDAAGKIAGTYLFPHEEERIKLRRALLKEHALPDLPAAEEKPAVAPGPGVGSNASEPAP